MVLQHGGLRLSNPLARRLTGFTDFGQSGADRWAAAPVPPGQPPRPTPGLTGPVVPGTPAWDTGGDDLLGAALQVRRRGGRWEGRYDLLGAALQVRWGRVGDRCVESWDSSHHPSLQAPHVPPFT